MAQTSRAELAARWTALAGPGHEECLDDLLRRYGEPHRRYHTAEHLAGLLAAIDRLTDPADSADDIAVVRYAAWFHDAVYAIGDPADGDARPGSAASNEERSARLAERWLSRMGLPSRHVAEVGRLVRLTEAHDPDAGDRAGSLLCDADLAILAGSQQEYERYRGQVREEYRRVPGDLFAAGRAGVLRALLAQPRLFRTARAHKLFEQAARANLTAEIALLASGA